MSEPTHSPSLCYDECDEASLIMQSLGKVPEACDPDGAFFAAYNSCNSCLNDNDSKATIRDYIDPEFVQFFNYCNAQSTQPSRTPKPSTDTTAVSEGTTTTESLVPYLWTDYTGGSWSINLEQTYLEDFLSKQGWRKDKEVTTTSAGDSTTISKSPNPDPEASQDQAWIAGPVVGAIAAIGMLAAFGVWLYRRKQKRKQTQDEEKEENVPELDPKHIPSQLENTETPKPKNELVGSEGHCIAEMPANEPVGQEMEGEHIFEKGLSDLPRIKRKPLSADHAGSANID